MIALSLVGKGRVVVEERATQRSKKIPFPPCLNVVYFTKINRVVIKHTKNPKRMANTGGRIHRGKCEKLSKTKI
jgi:ribosomal 50S subunit-recycling heat shock protein